MRLKQVYYGWYIALALAITETISYGVIYYSFSVFLTSMEAELAWTRTEITGAFSLALMISGLMAYPDRKSTRLNSSHIQKSRMPSSA